MSQTQRDSYVRTVCGDIAADDLGMTLMHEHLLCDFYRVTGNLNHLLNDVELAIEELALLKRVSGQALVEMTTPDMGRNPEGLVCISERTGIHIIMGTGWYRQPFYPFDIDRCSTDALATEMVRELTLGVSDVKTNKEAPIRAGIIGEIGINLDYATAQEERVLRAAARAHLQTGAPISTHASMYPVGLTQLDILAEEGVDAHNVIIGHADTYLVLEYHLELLERGAWVQFDTIGRQHMNPDNRRATALIALLELGWQNQLLLSSDRCHRSDLKAFGGLGYNYVFESFFDDLRMLGVSDDILEQLSVDNPCNILAWA